MKQVIETNERDRQIAVESLWQFEDPASGLPPIPDYMGEGVGHKVESISTNNRPSHLSSSFEAEKAVKSSLPNGLSSANKQAVAAKAVAHMSSVSSVDAPKNDFGIVKTIISKYSAQDLEELLSNCNKKQRLVLLQALLLGDRT